MLAWLATLLLSGRPVRAFGAAEVGPAPLFSPLAPLEDAWNYARVEYLSSVFSHSSTQPRYQGPGGPLISSSWQNRPYHVGWFVGVLAPDELVGGRVDQDEALFGGYRVGWDFDHYWGTEWRIGWSRPHLINLQEPQFERNGRLMMTDLNLLYYPWGDSVLRPYGLVGLGITEADFRDDLGIRRDDTLLTVPFGGGLKHHYRRWLSWRVELLDNFALDGGTAATMHNLSLTFGIEVHFGGRQPSFYPWNPSRHVGP